MRVLPRKPRTARRGSVMLLAVIVLGSLMALALSFGMSTLGHRREADANLDDRRAFYLAEAGVSEVVTALRGGGNGVVGSAAAPVQLGSGVFWSEATDLGDGETRVVVTSLVGSGRSAIDLVLREVPASGETTMFPATVFSDGDVQLGADVMVDSYDSLAGDYASQAVNVHDGTAYAGDSGDVRSNGGIGVGVDASVFGDAQPGPGESVSMDAGSYVSGATAPATEETEMPELEVPKHSNSGSLSVTDEETLPSGEYEFGSLKIGGSGRLLIVGPASIVAGGKFEAESGAVVEVDASGGPVVIYNVGTFQLAEGTTFELSTGSPGDMVLAFDSANAITLPPRTKFTGGIYAPRAPLHVDEECEIWGSIVADEVTMADGVKFHFDEYLLTKTITDPDAGVELEVAYWARTQLADDGLLADRRDPLRILGLTRDQLLSPSEGWASGPLEGHGGEGGSSGKGKGQQ